MSRRPCSLAVALSFSALRYPPALCMGASDCVAWVWESDGSNNCWPLAGWSGTQQSATRVFGQVTPALRDMSELLARIQSVIARIFVTYWFVYCLLFYCFTAHVFLFVYCSG